jgi:hypothetical protein
VTPAKRGKASKPESTDEGLEKTPVERRAAMSLKFRATAPASSPTNV